MMKLPKIDKYSLKARIIPTILTVVIPAIVFFHFFDNKELNQFIEKYFFVKVVYDLSIGFVFLSFTSQVGRFLSKHVFEKLYFKEELYMPTTNFLMFSNNQYSDEHKTKIRNKILKDFNTTLPSKEDELTDEKNARIRIVETMALIRKKLHTNDFVLQHNIEYGAMRNAIGGAVIGIFISSFNLIFFYEKSNIAFWVSTVLFVIYLFMIFFSKWIIDSYGKSYAKILFREYIGNWKC